MDYADQPLKDVVNQLQEEYGIPIQLNTPALEEAAIGTDSPVTVQFTTANGTATAGSDYTAASGTLTFAAGSTSQTVTVAVTGDLSVESDETFSITLSNPSANATLLTATGTGTIINDDSENDNTPPPAGQVGISGIVYFDINNNGVRDNGEAPIPGADRDGLVAGMRARGLRNVLPLEGAPQLASLVKGIARPGDYVVCLGAGNITQWAYALPGELDAMAG